MLKPKVGDLVRMKPLQIMHFDAQGGFHLRLENDSTISASATSTRVIEEILSRPLVVGDTVKIKAMVGSSARFTIIAIHDGEAWMKQIEPTNIMFGHVTYRLEAIEHAED